MRMEHDKAGWGAKADMVEAADAAWLRAAELWENAGGDAALGMLRELDGEDAALGKLRELDGADAALQLLHDRFTGPAMPELYVSEGDREALLAYIRRHGGDELEEALRTADEVAERRFAFRFRWDMERSHVPVDLPERIDWQHVPAGDEEWAYMLNRHRYWVALGQAYWLTGDERYARTYARQLADWIEANPWRPGEPSLAWRSIEAGLRAANWIKAFAYFRRSPSMTPELLGSMLASLCAHARCLAEQPGGWRSISNWGVLENQGLFALSLFLDGFPSAAQWRSQSLARLQEMARLQVSRDGWHWEQSPMYHNEVLHGLLDVLLLAERSGTALDPAIVETARRMAYADLYLAKPNGRQPMLGDSDDTDIRDIVTYAAGLFGDGCLKSGGYAHIDYDSAWSFGTAGIAAYEALEAARPPEASHAFAASGNFVMRSSWAADAAYLFFHCAPIGGGHGHADLLHFDVHAYGRDLLTDLGRHNYSEGDALRLVLKRCASHNTTTVDGIDFTECLGTWSFGRMARPMGVQWLSEAAFDYVEGSHDGYLHLPDPVMPLRRILFVKPGFWVLCDSFRAAGAHAYAQHFHFPPGAVQVEQAGGVVRTSNEGAANLAIIPVRPEELAAAIEAERIAPVYNQSADNYAATYRMQATGFASIVQVLYPLRPGESALPMVEAIPVYTYLGEAVGRDAAEACRITLQDSGDVYDVLICHKRPMLHHESYVIGGVQVFGEVVMIRRSAAGTEVVTVK